MGIVLSGGSRNSRPLGHRLGLRGNADGRRQHDPEHPARPGPRHPAHHRGNRPGRLGHDQRPPAGDRHRPRQRHRDGQSLHIRPPDGISGAVGRARRKRPGHCQARFGDRGDRAGTRQDRPRRCRGQGRALPRAAGIQHRHRRAVDRSGTCAAQCRPVDPRRAGRVRSPFDHRADRRHRRHPADRGRQLRHQPVGDRHRRRPLLDPRRFLGARTLRRGGQGRRGAVGDAARQSEGSLSPGRFRRSTTASTTRAARSGCRRRSPIRRFAARRHVVPGDDAVSRRHLSGRQPAGDPVGSRRRLRLGGRGRQGQARAGAHRPAQHRRRCWSTRRSPAATWW